MRRDLVNLKTIFMVNVSQNDFPSNQILIKKSVFILKIAAINANSYEMFFVQQYSSDQISTNRENDQKIWLKFTILI